MITEFQSLELDNELKILGDLSIINLLFMGKCILDKTRKTKNYCIDFSPEIKEIQ